MVTNTLTHIHTPLWNHHSTDTMVLRWRSVDTVTIEGINNLQSYWNSIDGRWRRRRCMYVPSFRSHTHTSASSTTRQKWNSLLWNLSITWCVHTWRWGDYACVSTYQSGRVGWFTVYSLEWGDLPCTVLTLMHCRIAGRYGGGSDLTRNKNLVLNLRTEPQNQKAPSVKTRWHWRQKSAFRRNS